MARKRMIDPTIWESAYDKNWTCEDFTVMAAAISASDDEGRGRVSMIFRNCGQMIKSEQKFNKILDKLNDSIIVFEKIYYFLPNWEKYQKVSHPVSSKIPKPNLAKNNSLTPNNSGMIPEQFGNDSSPSKSKISKYNLSKSKGDQQEEKEKSLTPTVDNFSFPTLTEEEDNSSPTTAAKAIFTPKDYQDDAQVKAVVTLMLARYCKEGAADKATVSRFFNIITKTENCVKKGETVSRKFTHRIMLETFQQYKDFSPETKNLPYLSRAVIGKINDAMIIHKEKNAKTEKDNLGKKTNELLNSQIDTDVGKEIVQFATDHKMPEPGKKKNAGFMDGITY